MGFFSALTVKDVYSGMLKYLLLQTRTYFNKLYNFVLLLNAPLFGSKIISQCPKENFFFFFAYLF